MGINDYGGTEDALNSPPLGGPGGWAEAVAAVVNDDDTTVDYRITVAGEDHVADADPHGQYLAESTAAATYEPAAWQGTQAQYDALGTWDPAVTYYVVG